MGCHEKTIGNSWIELFCQSGGRRNFPYLGCMSASKFLQQADCSGKAGCFCAGQLGFQRLPRIKKENMQAVFQIVAEITALQILGQEIRYSVALLELKPFLQGNRTAAAIRAGKREICGHGPKLKNRSMWILGRHLLHPISKTTAGQV